MKTARPRLRSIRARIVIAALLVSAVTLAAGGAGLVWILNRSLNKVILNTALTQLADVSSIVARGSVPPNLPVRPGAAAEVIDANGKVLWASSDLVNRSIPRFVRPRGAKVEVTTVHGVLKGDEKDLLVARVVNSGNGPLTIVALASYQQAETSIRSLAAALVVGLPIAVLLSGVLAWLLAGRALRPVESIRSEVAGLSAGDLNRRVPEPPYDDEIGRLARTMNAMLSRLEASSNRQKQLVSDASHELRSPIAALLAQLEVASSHPESANWTEVSDAVTEEANRLAKLVDDLLVLARRDEGHLLRGEEWVDIDEIVLSEAERIRTHDSARVDLRLVGAGRVKGDPDQLRRVVRNLGDNAVRHASSRVAFEVSQDDDRVTLVVADDGPGIPKEERLRVFERFTRMDEARDRPRGGAGLGLAIVDEIVRVHGGEVKIADSSVGARFIVQLPVE
jgi:signal transduction histidine kinase